MRGRLRGGGLIPARAGTTGLGLLRRGGFGAHPRSRGDHSPVATSTVSAVGSSPLARGPRTEAGTSNSSGGLIPARAGTTIVFYSSSFRFWAHPRSRGDHVSAIPHKVCAPGSSPLARGPRRGCTYALRGGGLIPARAGTTVCAAAELRGRRAHPRSRGDHSQNPDATNCAGGSSPLARGPPQCAHRLRHQPGLIPARAGTTAVGEMLTAACWAHPRSRGDHFDRFHIIASAVGSSPLARGPPPSSLKWRGKTGLIPARAGTTQPQQLKEQPERAHPRSRGDHRVKAASAAVVWGSSPLARGPRNEDGTITQVTGLIPARAGTTASVRMNSTSIGAHPRSRGDHSSSCPSVATREGSSPLARGPPPDQRR